MVDEEKVGYIETIDLAAVDSYLRWTTCVSYTVAWQIALFTDQESQID